MHTILSSLLAIYALGAGALATPASTDGRSVAFGTLGQDADLTIKTWNTNNCIDFNFDNANLSWGVTQNTYNPTNSFDLSRALRDSECLDWSDGQDCANSLRQYIGPVNLGAHTLPTVLQARMCYNLDLNATVSHLSGERAKCTN